MIFDHKDVKFQSLVWETGTEKDIITGLLFKNVHLDKFLQNLYGKKMLKFCWLSLRKIGNVVERFCEKHLHWSLISIRWKATYPKIYSRPNPGQREKN